MNIKTTVLYVLLFAVLTSCNIKDKLDKHEKAQKDADFIMNNLNKSEVVSHFPESSFPKEQTERLLGDISRNCDWSNRNGHFVDFTTMMNNGKSNVAFIYEYFLKCDSLRFILVYNIDDKEPKLFNFQMEPLEKKNPIVIHTEKQLLK